MKNPFRKSRNIKASAKALQIIGAGNEVLRSVSGAYIGLAALVDGVPQDRNYIFNPEKMEWEPSISIQPQGE